MRHSSIGRIVLTAAFLASAYVANSTHAAPEAGWVGASAPEKPVNVPQWDGDYAARFTGCDDHKRLGDVIMVGLDNHARRVTFDTAWRLTHDDSEATGGWVIGWCR